MLPDRLIQGYQTFVDGRLAAERSRYETLAEAGQKPEVMVIGCCDSRVAPETIFDAGPGELFVVRNVANLVPRCEDDSRTYHHGTSAAIEFAVQSLRVKHIVVLGHALCGGVRAVLDASLPLSPSDFIGKWVSQLEPLVERVGPVGNDFTGALRKLELEVVKHSLSALMTFPCVNTLVERGKLQLHGAYFGVATGMLLVLDKATGEFKPCVPAEAIPR